MIDNAIFRVDHPSGSYEIVVSEFFGTADKKKIKKLLRIASQYCTEAQRAELLAALDAESNRCLTAIQKLDELIGEQQRVISNFFCKVTFQSVTPSAVRAIARRREKVLWSRSLIAETRWEG